MSCVTSVTYFFLVNGEVTGYIAHTCDIRQGDPLSPIYFSFVRKVLLVCLHGMNGLALFIGFLSAVGCLASLILCLPTTASCL